MQVLPQRKRGGDDMPEVKSGWGSSDFAVVAILLGPWAMQHLGIDITTIASILGYMPTDAKQVEVLAEALKNKAGSDLAPLAGIAYVIVRPIYKAYMAKLLK
jgi:hypothetical protein